VITDTRYLQPCPWCGTVGEPLCDLWEAFDGGHIAHVHCAKCGADGPSIYTEEGSDAAISEARVQWNERSVLMRAGIDALVHRCHTASKRAGWWQDLNTGEPLPLTQERIGDKLMLIVTEVAEAKEGHRKGLQDTHLPDRPMIEVELADALIRIADLAGAMGLDLAGAVSDKLRYNASRQDHRLENRRANGGKKT
jgi:NTP pyrophosphatase (non-canonical NTP hydrolase)